MQIAEPKDFGQKNKGKAAFADGTAVPTKRARVSNTAEPDALRNNRQHRSITDFFNSVSPSGKSESGRPEASIDAREDDQSLDLTSSHTVLSSTKRGTQADKLQSDVATESAVAQNTTADDVDGAQPQKSEGVLVKALPTVMHADFIQPLPGALRQVLARAAMRRAAQQPTDGPVVQQPAEGPAAQQPADGPADKSRQSPASSAAKQRLHYSNGNLVHSRAEHDATENPDIAHVSAVFDLVDECSQPDTSTPSNTKQNKPSTIRTHTPSDTKPSCPVCGLSWPGSIDPAVMYQHVDVCLQQQLV